MDGSAEIEFGDNNARAEVTRSEPGCWEFGFIEPQELCGVTMKLENGHADSEPG